MFRIAPTLLIAAALGACAASAPPGDATCAGDTVPAATVQMLFGRAIGAQGEVGDSEWRDFVATAITPRFPDGLTVIEGEGQFRGASGAVLRERAKIVMIVVPDAAAAMERIDAIAETYKTRFRQDSVGVVITPACARFG